MPTPTKQLGKLSIGNMSRSQSQAERAGANVPYEGDTETEESSSDGEDAETATAFVVRGTTDIPYDLSDLSQVAKVRAMQGLKGDFTVDRCRSLRGGLDFDIADHGRIRLIDESLVCSCSDFTQTNLACRHIFWLVDQLHRGFYPGLPPEAIDMSDTGETPFFDRIAESLSEKIEEIARKRNWPYLPGASSPSDSSSGESDSSMTRPQKARDILSAFDKTLMPDNFRPDLVETIAQPRTPEQCVVQGDFEATIFRLAVHDENVYSGLRKVMPSGARAEIYFEKAKNHIRTLLADFDRYRETGAARRDGVRLEIPVVVKELREHLEQIQHNILARSPHGAAGAADALVSLLRDISHRNYDAFEESDWGRRTPAGETEDDRNLYLQLVGQIGHTKSFFVLDCLETIPELVLRQWASQLDAIFTTVHANGASVQYLRKLQAIKAGERPSTDKPSQKRAALGAAATGRKRTK